MQKESEDRVETSLVNRIRHAGGKAYKFTSPGTGGVPDRIVVLNGSVWFIELKSTEGRPTNLQKKRIRELARMGAKVTVLGSCSEVDEFVKCLSNGRGMQELVKRQAEKYGLSEECYEQKNKNRV